MTFSHHDRRYGDLPWGWWLRVRDCRIEDEHGRSWRTVRDAFWEGEVGFPAVHFAPEQHELLARVLASIGAAASADRERREDLFGGDWMFWRFYRCWLVSIGMVEAKVGPNGLLDPFHASLSDKGRSVLLMLQATREPAWERLPLAEVVAAVAAAFRDETDDTREAALQAFERSVGFRRHLFARERIGRLHVVTLTGLVANARMPMMRVSWSQAFDDPAGRDDLFAWLAARIDRWDDWARLAHDKGADALTRHLLGLIVAGGGLTA